MGLLRSELKTVGMDLFNNKKLNKLMTTLRFVKENES